ncbi:MAG: ATP-dependent Clp protease proteolytic subunit [Candidatus Acidiferrum sp.]
MSDDADFTPNRDRSIRVDGAIDHRLEDRLRPQILELTAGSREPITVFIDSEGGSAAAGERILELLRSPHQDGASCRIITVARAKAWSAAADLLSAGDFAIAHPGSRLLYHGTRITTPQPVTADHASLLADVLKSSNRRFSASLLEKSAERFLFLLFALRATFEEHRAGAGGRTLSDLDCLQEISCRKAPPAAQKVLRQAANIWDRYHGLVTHFEEQAAIARLFGETTEIEKIMLASSISFECENNKTDPQWSLRTGGLNRINEHFFFLDEYFQGTNGACFAMLCERWAPLIIAEDGQELLSAEEKARKFRRYFPPFWSFFIALCHALQRSEHELTAMDAFWLGLIDTVRADLTAP